jgi:hypothetical protein
MKQHITPGQPGSMYSTLNIGSDPNNHIELGSPWNGYYDGQAYSGGTRLYWNGSGVAPVDGATVFLVYRIDFGHQAGNTSPDKILLWVNPAPGTTPSDASATTTWTLPTGTYFNFTDSNIKLSSGSYWNQTTYDEVRLGKSYISVAPDPMVLASLEANPPVSHRSSIDAPVTIAAAPPAPSQSQPISRFLAPIADLPAVQGNDAAVSVVINHRMAPLVSLMTSDTPTAVVDLTPDLQPIKTIARRHVPGLDHDDQGDQADQEPSFWD